MIEVSEQMVKAFAKFKSNKNPLDLTKDNSKPFTSNKHNYTEYEELFYYFEKNSQNEYIATVYGIPEIHAKNEKITTCENVIRKKIDRYIFNHKTQLLNYPRPIPDGISLYYETVKASTQYELRKLTTISLRNAFRKINEQTIAILEKNYGKITHDELDKALEIEKIYTYRHGDIIKKLINGLNLYDNNYNQQINISKILSKADDQPDFFYIFIPNNNISDLEIESDNQNIEYFPCQESDTYKFLFKPSLQFAKSIFQIKITTNTQKTKRTYLTISKINAETYSYSFTGSEQFNTGNGSLHLCANKNIIDKLTSIFPKSISDSKPQLFALFIFEFSKLLQFAIFSNFSNRELSEYIEINRPIPPKCYNLLILKDDLDTDRHDLQDPTTPFIDTVHQTLNFIKVDRSVSAHNFSILKIALQKSDELNLDIDTIHKCHIHCWEYILSDSSSKILANIALLKIRDGLSNTKIFSEICPNKKYFSQVKKELNLRAEKFEDIGKNTAQIIQSRYDKIYSLANQYDLPKPNLGKCSKT